MKTNKLILTSLFLSIGIILPYVTSHSLGMPGTFILPMHLPVLTCGLLLGWQSGLICGILTPLISSILTNMPPAYPMLPIMLCELSVYGLVGGLLSKKFNVYISLIGAMICGRIAYAGMFYILLLNNPNLKALSMFAAVATGILGIALQILIIPPIITLLQDRNIITIRKKKFDCVITKDNKKIELNGNGVKPLLQNYEELADAIVYDKIIGKAAAVICVNAGAKKVYGKLMSKPAKEYLKKNGIKFSYDMLVDKIQNRAGDGICPLENCVLNEDDSKKGLIAIKKTIEELMKK